VDKRRPATADLLLSSASVRNPIYSHKLSLIGFWSLALFYPFVGIHHYLYSRSPTGRDLAIITSMLLIVPCGRCFRTSSDMVGRWQAFGTT